MSIGVPGESHNNWLDQQVTNKKGGPNPLNETNTEPVGNSITSFLPIDKSFNTEPYKQTGIAANINIFDAHIDPKGVVDEIRNAKDSNSRNNLLIDFQSKIDKMPSKDLAVTRDYLISLIENKNNNDDELLFLLLKTVNKRLDNEHFRDFQPNPIFIEHLPVDLIGRPKIMFD
jgi:hypothetical protein